MKTVELAEANAPLSEYAREATKQTLVVTRKGKPILALMRLPPDADLENLSVTTHPTFQAIVQRRDTIGLLLEARFLDRGGELAQRTQTEAARHAVEHVRARIVHLPATGEFGFLPPLPGRRFEPSLC